MTLPPKSYVFPGEAARRVFERVWLEPDAYADAIRAFPVICADVLPYDPQTRSLLLAERTARPARGLWMIGGRLFAGERGLEAAVRHFAADTGLPLPRARFRFLGVNEYFFQERAQAPQDLPCHSVCYVFAVALAAGEIDTVSRGLRPPEYRPGSLRPVPRAALAASGIHPALRDLGATLFGPEG